MTRSLIVEADGGSRGNPGPAAYGALVRDAATGAVLSEVAEYIGEATNNVAEYRGALSGLEQARAIDADARVEVRMDSKLVVEQMSGRWQIKHAAMRELAMQARAVLPAAQVTFTWIPRAQNSAADALVNAVLDQVGRGGEAIIRRGSASPVDAAPMDVVGEAEEDAAQAEQAPKTQLLGWTNPAVATVTLMVRHGATELTVGKKFSGNGGFDAPLSELGLAQAAAIAGELSQREAIDVVIASPLQRTRQTAGVIAEALGLEVEIDEGFVECAFGEWDGYTLAEVRERWPAELERWLGSTEYAPPGGESFAQVRDRVDAARAAVVRRHAGKRIAIVSHVTPIKSMVTLATGAPLTSLFRMELSPCSLTTLGWFEDGNSSMFGFSESAHLREVYLPGV